MKYKAVIFDLDQTLVDSSALQLMRDARQWSKVLQSLNLAKIDSQTTSLLKNLTNAGCQIGVITNSPGMYAKAILDFFQFKYSYLVAYHDVTRRKPHPEAFLKMIKDLNLDPSFCISVGDHDNDISASKAAKIMTVGARWYTKNYTFSVKPDYVFETVQKFEQFLNQKQ